MYENSYILRRLKFYLYPVAGALLVVQLCVAGAGDDDAALVVVDELQ